MATAARIIGLTTSSSTKKLHPEKSRLSAWCQATPMSAVVGDVGQIGSLFAGLAAIVTLFLFGASGCEHLFGFPLLIPPPIPQAARRPLNRSMMRTTNATPSNK